MWEMLIRTGCYSMYKNIEKFHLIKKCKLLNKGCLCFSCFYGNNSDTFPSA